ncbi:MAG: hypothetical protein CBC29_03690 [Methylococcaceae bacterium TMED69]|nr:MAG: hypothetical protein CBC29_03690 [Methylococcaceae bacterium TMED69]|tara:strand:- start:749 stop:1180 length:432 start_codon:yes stop_codon:yes gene_type:complete
MEKRTIKWDLHSVDLEAFPELHSSKIPPLLFISKFFDDGIENFKKSMGLTKQYIATKMKSTVALQSSITIYHWVHDNQLNIKTRAKKFDGRKVIMEQNICSREEILITQTTLSISFDIYRRKSCYFDEKIAINYKKFIDGDHY